MKSLVAGILLLAQVNAIAGEIINKKTNEKLILNVNHEYHSMHIESTDESLPSKWVSLKTASQKKSEVRLYALSGTFCENLGDVCLVFIALPPFLPVLAAVDTLILPVKLPIKLIQNATFKKDFNVLEKAIATDEVFEVGEKRFNRIVKILKKAE